MNNKNNYPTTSFSNKILENTQKNHCIDKVKDKCNVIMNNANESNENNENNNGNILTFNILSPGGNNTCLIDGIIEDPTTKRIINNRIMGHYNNVEQVGFVDLDNGIPRLEMAGGEFCGNATRSMIYKHLNGKQGEGIYSISGTKNNLNGGISELGEVWSEMPIYNDINKIIKLENGDYKVEMEGIIHYIKIQNKKYIPNNGYESENKLQLDSYDIIMKNSLTENQPAAGVIYVYKNNNEIFMQPVVYVKKLDQLFIETACGSGATAIGLVEALEKNGSIEDLPIIQPSGETIKVSVDYNCENRYFEKAIIKGKVRQLLSGEIDTTINNNYLLEICHNNEQLSSYLNNGLTKIYKECFKNKPYYELFSDDEIKIIFENYVNNNGEIFLLKNKNEIIGFSSCIKLIDEPEILGLLSKYLKELGIDYQNCKYFSDLGINTEYRNKGLAIKLIEKHLNNMLPGETVIMRTNENNFASYNIFKKMGFIKIDGATQEVATTKLSGKKETDLRIFCYYSKK